MLFPNTMTEPIGLDKLEEDKIIDEHRSKFAFVPFKNMVSQRPPVMLAPRTTPINHFSEYEIRYRRGKWIFYNCYEKFT